MIIDYKKELETAAKNMILVHEPDVLIKLIVRMMVHKIKVGHAALLLYNKDKNGYVSTFSRGRLGLKMPHGFIRINTDNSIIRLFTEFRNNQIPNNKALVCEDVRKILSSDKLDPSYKEILLDVISQLEVFETAVCVPSYFHDKLLAVLLLGKKKNQETFIQEELNFFIALASDVAMAIRNAQLFKELKIELDKKRHLFFEISSALAAAIDAKDHYTHKHIMRVTNLSLEIAGKIIIEKKVKVDDNFFEDLQIASLLHDIGKIGIPEVILNKRGPLDDNERKIIKEHPLIGAAILEHIKELKTASLGVKYHHERYDGKGYPEGLRGDTIPLIAAIIAVADSFDAMTTERPYRAGLSLEKTLSEIKSLSGLQFHPLVVSALMELHQENKIHLCPQNE